MVMVVLSELTSATQVTSPVQLSNCQPPAGVAVMGASVPSSNVPAPVVLPLPLVSIVSVYWGVGIFICTLAPVKVVPAMGSPVVKSLRVPVTLILVEVPPAPTAVNGILATVSPPVNGDEAAKPVMVAVSAPVVLANIVHPAGDVGAEVPNKRTLPVSQVM